MTPITAAHIRAARLTAGLTQPEAARLIGRTLRQWQRYESGISRLDPILWRAWQAKAARFIRKSTTTQEPTP
jgi:transcriptional regulator with XRE-family HTH domain